MKSKRLDFGPWTSSLDNGHRLELSAFWKRRMAALSQLPQAPWRARGRWLVVAIATMAVVALTPLWRISPEAAVADDRPADAKAGDPAAGKFVAKFSNGVEVELIGLSKNPSKNEPWWRPDGTPLGERPYSDVRAVMGSGLPREICFRWRNLPKDPDYTLSWNTVPPYECAGGGPVDAEGKRVKDMWATAIGLTGSPETCTVKFSASVSATPWKTVFDDDGRHYSSAGSTVDSKQRGVIWSPARQQGDDLVITLSYKAPGESVRLVAVDKSGKEQAASSVFGGGSWDFMQQTFEFDGLSLDKVDHFELQTQTRQIETVEFVNVSLEPDKITKVETKIGEADKPEPAQVRGAPDKVSRSSSWTPLQPRGLAYAARPESSYHEMAAWVKTGEQFPVKTERDGDERFMVSVKHTYQGAVVVNVLEQTGKSQQLELRRDEPVRVTVGNEDYTLAVFQVGLPGGTVDRSHIGVSWQPRETPQPASWASKFGPVVELTLSNPEIDPSNSYIDFDAGQLWSPPAGMDSQQTTEWVEKNGIDARANLSIDIRGLAGFDMVVVRTTERQWNPRPEMLEVLDSEKRWTPVPMPGTPLKGRLESSRTFLFETRERGRGVLQIVGRDGDQAVKIRYKMATMQRSRY